MAVRYFLFLVVLFGSVGKSQKSEFQWAMTFGECRSNADSEVYLHMWSVSVLKSRLGIWIQMSGGRNVKYSDCQRL